MQVAANSLGKFYCQGIRRDNNSSTYKFHRKNRSFVLRRKFIIGCGIAEPSGQPAPMGQKTRYSDNLFDKTFMALFARKMNNIAGGRSIGRVDGYERFVETSRSVMQGRTPKQQQEAVRQVLLSMLPPGAPERVSIHGDREDRDLPGLRNESATSSTNHSVGLQFRKLFPPTKWAAEFNAAVTPPFFHWLVGPSEVVEVEVNGLKQKSGVHIKKCRYLENSGCVGMCINMCKLPTQDFFTNEFGLPLTMTPNFEDMSCDMVYGQPPPPPEEDPAFKQPCYAALCSMAQPDSEACPKVSVR